MEEQRPIAAAEHVSDVSTNGFAQGHGETAQGFITHQAQEELWWRGLVEFGCHIFVGTLIFVLIAMAAIGLDFLLKWLKTLEVNGLILIGLTIAKITVFIADFVLYMIYLANMSWKFLCSMTWPKSSWGLAWPK